MLLSSTIDADRFIENRATGLIGKLFHKPHFVEQPKRWIRLLIQRGLGDGICHPFWDSSRRADSY
jgi:hypothetical protein